MLGPQNGFRVCRRPLQVFCASTSGDLESYREAVESVTAHFNSLYIGMEYFGARTDKSIDVCRSEVERADVLVTLAGTRYGSLCGEFSYTEHEVRHAHEKGIPVLAFLLNTERQPVLKRHVAMGEEAVRLNAFITWLQSNYTTTKFTTPENLATLLAASLMKHLQGGGMNDGFREIVSRLSRTRDWPYDVFGISAHNVDFVHLVDSLETDETAAAEAGPFAGGSGANTVYGLSKLGCRTAITGVVAGDVAGASLVEDLKSVRVNCDLVLSMPAGADAVTGHTRIYSDNQGGRKIYVAAGLNERFAEQVKSDATTADRLASMVRVARILHCSSFTGYPELELTEELIAKVPSQTVVSLAPGSIYARLGLDRLVRLIARTNILFLYEAQLDSLLSRHANYNPTRMPLQDKLQVLFQSRAGWGGGEPLLVAIKKTRGSLGATLPADIEVGYGRDHLDAIVPPARVTGDNHPRGRTDSTGSKDALAAGILFGLLRGMEVNETVDLGYAMAHLAARKIGARSALPSLIELSRFCGIKIPA